MPAVDLDCSLRFPQGPLDSEGPYPGLHSLANCAGARTEERVGFSRSAVVRSLCVAKIDTIELLRAQSPEPPALLLRLLPCLGLASLQPIGRTLQSVDRYAQQLGRSLG